MNFYFLIYYSFGWVPVYYFFSFSFALMQKKQKIKDNPIAPRVCPAIATILSAE
ncbi:MAG: hypothetical protein M3Z26_10340 [Bacteroidota bacterium]|nr:hypothetical protein [Bacteroidota bacterium]